MSEENSKLEKISFFDVESGEEVELYVVEQTTLNQVRYLLVAEDDKAESEGYIFKETSEKDDELTYEPVVDDNEYEALIKVFSELLEDADLI